MKIFRSCMKKFEEFENADAVLSRWKKLKVLHVESETEIQRFENFSEHKLLEKIVVEGPNSPGNRIKSEELGSWGIVTKSWFNPKQPLNPATLENVVAIEIDLNKTQPNFEIENTAQRMKNLEDLKIKCSSASRAIFEFNYSSFKNLKNVDFNIKYCPIQSLIVTLNFMASLNLKISGCINVSDDCSSEQARNIFEEAVTILNENFPGKCEIFKIYGGKTSRSNLYGMVQCIDIRFDRNIAAIEYNERRDY